MVVGNWNKCQKRKTTITTKNSYSFLFDNPLRTNKNLFPKTPFRNVINIHLFKWIFNNSQETWNLYIKTNLLSIVMLLYGNKTLSQGRRKKWNYTVIPPKMLVWKDLEYWHSSGNSLFQIHGGPCEGIFQCCPFLHFPECFFPLFVFILNGMSLSLGIVWGGRGEDRWKGELGRNLKPGEQTSGLQSCCVPSSLSVIGGSWEFPSRFLPPNVVRSHPSHLLTPGTYMLIMCGASCWSFRHWAESLPVLCSCCQLRTFVTVCLNVICIFLSQKQTLVTLTENGLPLSNSSCFKISTSHLN